MPHFIGKKKGYDMETFKVGNHVYAEEDFIYGRIVELDGDLAYVEFRTPGGGGCLPYKLSELEHEKWCITTKLFENETHYLAWQEPVWGEDGYFWTSRETLQKVIGNNTSEHPFLFNNRRSAIRHLKTINIPQKCRVVRW